VPGAAAGRPPPPTGRGAVFFRFGTAVSPRAGPLTLPPEGFKIDYSWCARFDLGGKSMRCSLAIRLALGLAFVLALFALSPAGAQQQPKKDAKDAKKGEEKKKSDNSEPVSFTTVDLVTLQGNFYPSKQGKKAPCVLMLHTIGSDSGQNGWDQLATELQKKGCAVLTFDFRGHGKSTDVDVGFWKDVKNQQMVKGYNPNKPKEHISHKDFNSAYYTRLVDDIAAAKFFLDRKNDSGELNSSSLIIVGAEEGGALGALWMESEFSRFKARQNQPLIATALPQLLKIESSLPEGKGITAAYFLNLSPTVQRQSVGIHALLKNLGRERKIPMAFIFGAKSSNAETQAGGFVEAATGGDKTLAKQTGMKGIKGTDLVGHKLLTLKQPEAIDFITSNLDNVLTERSVPEWDRKEVDKSAFVWQIGASIPFPAKYEGERNLLPLPLQRFIR
jgi:hypothetical protein